jgi:glyoxylase I family protein
MKPEFVDHLVFRVADVGKTQKFYSAFLGEPLESASGSVVYQVGGTKIFFTAYTATDVRGFDKEQLGLNHLAFGVRKIEELRRIGEELRAAGIQHSGIQIDKYGNKEFIWFDDPDGMRLEFYLREQGKS